MTPARSFLDGGGEAARMIRERDWSGHPLGPPETWPAELKAALSLVLNSPESMILAWGPELSFFFNDTYFPLLGPRLAWAMGERFDQVWADGWEQAKPIIDDAFAGRAKRFIDLPWKLGTDRGARDTWWTFSYSRVLDAEGAVAGLFIFTNETTARVLGDAALRESEERLRLVIEGAKDHAILTTDPDGTIMSWSAGAEATFGWSAEEAIGQPAAIIFTPEDRAAGIDRHEFETAAREGAASDKRWHLTRAGTRVFMNGSVHPLPRDAQDRARGFIKVARNETDRWQAERRLAAEAERQRLSLQQMPGFAAILSGPGHVFDYVNDAYVTIAGARAFLGRSVRAVFPDLEGQGFYELLDEVYATGRPFTNRAMPIRLAGEDEDRFIDLLYHPIRDEQGAVTGIFVGGYDVTEGVRSLASLRDSEARFRTVAEALPGFIWTADAQGALDYASPRWHAYSGMEPGSNFGAKWVSVVHPDDQAKAVARWAEAVTTQTPYEVEFRLRRADGTFHWWLARARPAERTADNAPSWVGVCTELDDIIAARETLSRSREELERLVDARTQDLMRAEEALRQSQKMEAVGQLTGGLAHDFNNLLAGISGSLELLQARLTQGRLTEIERYMVAAQGAAKRAAALTHRLLAFSRRQTLDPQPTDVNRLVGGMQEMVQRTVGPAVTIEVVEAAGLWPALVDPSQLENALLNLCINARDALPEGGGRITIETANKWMDERAAREHDVPEGQYLSLCVTDTGTGMTPDVIARAFDPFFTTKPIGQGTGLGLSMIYGFAKQSGGQVRIYSEVGQGTTVRIYLPRHYGEVEDAERSTEVPALPRSEQGATVLIVDDEPTVRMLVTDILEDLDYSAIEAGDSAAGLRILQSDVRIDLLITDVGLPGGMNGRQMADAARMRRPSLKVLFITGYAENAVIGNGYLAPGMAVLTKPFAIERMAARIRSLIEAEKIAREVSAEA